MNEFIRNSGSSLAFATALPPAILLAVATIATMIVGRTPPATTIFLLPILVAGGIAWQENWRAILTNQEKMQFSIEHKLSDNVISFLLLRLLTYLMGFVIVGLLGWAIIAL